MNLTLALCIAAIMAALLILFTRGACLSIAGLFAGQIDDLRNRRAAVLQSIVERTCHTTKWGTLLEVEVNVEDSYGSYAELINGHSILGSFEKHIITRLNTLLERKCLIVTSFKLAKIDGNNFLVLTVSKLETKKLNIHF